ncbi:gypsy type transposase [Tanacetum coccineum]|uniref:Gypsy type transposase n=1 Tax=Tanacetum coccineum TaxID=301880 RepID=A0ABQ5FW87_9ASTR
MKLGTLTNAYQEANVPGLYILAMAIVDCVGHRSVLHGNLQGDERDLLLYGSLDSGKKICGNQYFHAKDLKDLSFKINIPLDLHPVALTAEWAMDKLTDDFIGLYEQYFEFSGVRVSFSTLLLVVLDHFRMHISQGLVYLREDGWSHGKILNETFSGLKGWKKRFFFLDRRVIPQAMAWRHHDSNIHDPLPTDGLRTSDVATLNNQSIDIRLVPSGLLFHAGLATTWEFSGFLPVFKDTKGNSNDPLLFKYGPSTFSCWRGDALSARDPITQRTTGPLPVNQSLPEKTARLKEVEIFDPKIIAIRERKARAAAKKQAEKKRAADGEGGSKGKTKRRKVSVVRAEEEDSTEEASSASPLPTMAPNPSFLLKDVDDAGTAESREDEHVSVPRHDSANTSIHNYAADHDERFDELTESPVPARNPEKTAVQDLVPVVRSNLAGDHADGAESSRPGSVYVPEWTIHRRSRVDTPEECRELLTHLAPPAVREEMNAYDNNTAMERAWFSIARGAMAQTDALLRFEALYDAHLALKERCEDVTRQLVSTRTDFTHVSNLYNTLSNRYQQVRGEHAGCAEKLINAERERDELRAVNADQVSQIKELEAELARKDSALVFSDRVSNERAVENERLVSKLGYFEKEKIDSIGKLLPTVVRRLLNSHEYKESLSIPFNLAIQAGWAKGLAVKRSEEDLMDVLREVQGFDPYSDTRMTVEYDKLFTKTYPFIEKISGLPRRTVQELLKMYPAPPPQDVPTKVNPSSQAPDSSKSVPKGANV